jgi:transposase
MELRENSSSTYARTRPVVSCAQCGHTIYIPEWSEHLDERRVRHLWECETCGYQFETLVCFPE